MAVGGSCCLEGALADWRGLSVSRWYSCRLEGALDDWQRLSLSGGGSYWLEGALDSWRVICFLRAVRSSSVFHGDLKNSSPREEAPVPTLGI